MAYDYLVIGAGISGAAAACELCAHGTVALIEAESQPGYHSTGRSAALFTGNYGGAVVRRINVASRVFFEAPPEGFCDGPLLVRRGTLTIAPPGEEAGLDLIVANSMSEAQISRITPQRALELAPFLRPDRVAGAAYEAGVMDIEVARLHQGFLRGLKRQGGTCLVGWRVDSLAHGAAGWEVASRDKRITGRILINAAGAWAGQIGAMAGAADIGLVPKRRTGIIVDAPAGIDVAALPVVEFVGSDAYLKPDAGRLMASPGDQTPMDPQDVRPDEMDMAVLVDWLETETLITVRRITHSWAGLRSFVRDEAPVVGFDIEAPDFFWLAGQGGFGIMMAPALARATTELILHGDLPADLLAAGIGALDLSPARLN